MTQRQIGHPAGELPDCVPECGRQPKHYVDQRRAAAGGGHFLECAHCDRRTPKSRSLAVALANWQRMVGAPASTARADSRVRSIR